MSKPDSETVTKGIDPKDKDSLLEFVRKSDDNVQQLLHGEKMVDVIFTEIEKHYEIFSIKGAYAKVCIDDFENQPIKVEEMGEGINKDGTPKEKGDEADMYMSAYCFNKVTGMKDEKVVRDNVWKLKNLLHSIVFGGDIKQRTSPPKGISKEEMTTIKFEWESYKYKVVIAKDSYRKIELRIQKLLKKALKTKNIDERRKAETILIEFLQKNMKLKTGHYTSAIGFANYFLSMFKAVFPKDFGTDVRIKKLKEDGDW